MALTRVDMLLKQFDSNWTNDDWGVPLRRALDGVTAKEAAWAPPGGGNTIRQLVQHMNFYNERMLCRLTGEGAMPEAESNTATFGEPGDPEDEKGWQAEVARAFDLRDRLRTRIAGFTDEELSKPLGDSSADELLPLWMMHDAFHGGQIVVLRRVQMSWPGTIWP